MDNTRFVNAYFTSDDRKTITTFWEDPVNPDAVIEVVIEADEKQAEYKKLMDHISLDEIHENTWRYIKDSEQAFKDTVIEIARERGWLVNMDDGGTSDFHKVVVDMIFDPYDEEIHKEKLFFMKLQLFEKDFMKNSKDKEGKKKVRRAQTPLAAIKAAIDIFETSSDPSSADTSD